jgi:hypothetical protein
MTGLQENSHDTFVSYQYARKRNCTSSHLLVAFIEVKILNCILGVNLEVVNFLGAKKV